MLGEDLGLDGLEDAVEPAEDGEWEDDPAVFGLFVVPPEEISDGPDERGEVGIGHGGGMVADEGQVVCWGKDCRL